MVFPIQAVSVVGMALCTQFLTEGIQWALLYRTRGQGGLMG